MSSSIKPIIGVTGPAHGGLAAWLFTALALRLQGARTLRITPARAANIGPLDGLVIGGGADISPDRYGMEKHLKEFKREMGKQPRAVALVKWLAYPLIIIFRKLSSTKRHLGKDQDRDELELNLLRDAVARKIPVLGICRGAQLINVYFGGTLHQDLSDFYVETAHSRSVFPNILVEIEPDSCLAKLLGTTRCHVNALHNQAVNSLGEGIHIAARESTGVVQAIERRDMKFMVGVQWHPEYLLLHDAQRALFSQLVAAAKEHDTQK